MHALISGFAAALLTTTLGVGPSSSAPRPTIPSDFPLAHGLVDGGDYSVTGPAPGVRGIDLRQLCGFRGWPGRTSGRLVVRQLGPESAQVRQLVTYPSRQAARHRMDRLRAALAACPVDPGNRPANDNLFFPLTADTGHDSITFGQTFRVGVGGAVYQFVRIGNAVLGVSDGGEWAQDSIRHGARALTRRDRYLVEQMCVFRPAGC